MRRVLPLPADLDSAQQWVFSLGGVRGDDADFALAYAILLAPPSGKDEHQHLLVLKDSKLKKRAGECKRHVREIREKLFALGPIGGEYQDRLTEHVRFSSPSLAASVLYGGSRDGWISWQVHHGLVSAPGETLESAYDSAKKGSFTITYYEMTEPTYRID
jgi:hypothetical protein